MFSKHCLYLFLLGALLYDIYIFVLCHLSQFLVWRLTWNSSLEYKLAITTLIAIGISSISIIHQGQCLVFTATIPPRLILRTKITRICIFRCVWPISPIFLTIICMMPNKPYAKMPTRWNYLYWWLDTAEMTYSVDWDFPHSPVSAKWLFKNTFLYEILGMEENSSPEAFNMGMLSNVWM